MLGVGHTPPSLVKYRLTLEITRLTRYIKQDYSALISGQKAAGYPARGQTFDLIYK